MVNLPEAKVFWEEDVLKVACPHCHKIWRGEGIKHGAESGELQCGNGLVGLGCGKKFRPVWQIK